MMYTIQNRLATLAACGFASLIPLGLLTTHWLLGCLAFLTETLPS